MILAQNGHAADEQQVAEFLAFADQRRITLSELWITEQGGRLLWAVLPILSPGRTMLLFAPPDPLPVPIMPAATALLDTICQRFAGQDIQLAQVLLDPGDDPGRRLFEGRGFKRMAELIYLSAPIKRPLPPPPLAPGISILPYSPHTHSLFAGGILASYQQSLDCPALNGVRQIEDIIAGHKAGGDFDPRHWYVLCTSTPDNNAEIPIGVLLLCRLPRGDSAELVYLGLAPAARGKGLGDWMMRRAFTTRRLDGRCPSVARGRFDQFSGPQAVLPVRDGENGEQGCDDAQAFLIGIMTFPQTPPQFVHASDNCVHDWLNENFF